MLLQIVSLLLGTAADLLAIAFLARVWMQWARAPFRNSLGHFVIVATDWAVKPLRRIVPGLFGIDFASLLAAWLVQIAFLGVMAGLTGAAMAVSGGAMLGVVWIAALTTLRLFVYLLMGVVIVAALLSWINPHSPFASIVDGLARPLLAPLRRLIPPIGGIDLTPLAVLLLLQVVLIVLAGLSPYRF
jgi:YggT family protein